VVIIFIYFARSISKSDKTY